MSDTKINVKSNNDNTVSLNVELEVRPPVWSKKYVKFLPNEEYQRFHWTDAYRYLVKEGYNVENKPKSGPVKVNNSSEEVNTGEWVFRLANLPSKKTEASTPPSTKAKTTVKTKATVKKKTKKTATKTKEV